MATPELTRPERSASRLNKSSNSRYLVMPKDVFMVNRSDHEVPTFTRALIRGVLSSSQQLSENSRDLKIPSYDLTSMHIRDIQAVAYSDFSFERQGTLDIYDAAQSLDAAYATAAHFQNIRNIDKSKVIPELIVIHGLNKLQDENKKNSSRVLDSIRALPAEKFTAIMVPGQIATGEIVKQG